MKRDSEAEILLMKHIRELGLYFQREVGFHPERKWRFDYALLREDSVINLKSLHVAIEIEGGAWTHGRHTRGKGFEADIRKYNEAAKLGWTVIRFTPNMIKRGESKAFLQEMFNGK